MQKQIVHPVVILFIIQFLVMVGFGIVIPILPFLITELGGGALSLGIFMSVYSIMQFFFAPFWGRLSDKIGRRPVILIGLFGYGVTFFLFGIAGSIPLLIVFRALSGMISSATIPTAMAYLSDITEGAERSRSMGMIGAAMGLGMICGPVIGGWIGHYNISMPFFVAGGLALLIFPFAWGFLPETLKKPLGGLTRQTPRLSWTVIQNPMFILFVYNFILSFTMSMFETTYALFAAAKVGFGPREMGTAFMIFGVASTIVQGGLIGKLVKKFGDVNIMKAGVYFSAAGFVFILLASNSILIVAASIIFVVGTALMGPTSTSLVTKQSTHGQGAALGIFQSFGSLGRILGPVTGGALYGVGITIPYILGAVALMLTVLSSGRKAGALVVDKTC